MNYNERFLNVESFISSSLRRFTSKLCMHLYTCQADFFLTTCTYTHLCRFVYSVFLHCVKQVYKWNEVEQLVQLLERHLVDSCHASQLSMLMILTRSISFRIRKWYIYRVDFNEKKHKFQNGLLGWKKNVMVIGCLSPVLFLSLYKISNQWYP